MWSHSSARVASLGKRYLIYWADKSGGGGGGGESVFWGLRAAPDRCAKQNGRGTLLTRFQKFEDR